ncbi:UDP-glycosyltransferase UGT5-like [Drosophila tropicalis]|uniref:UDP-glycosyltransferase UGT5-like n=1 Tax=Drosophila tropicalis TaxID=46794 RepID=UPI0035ABBBB0
MARANGTLFILLGIVTCFTLIGGIHGANILCLFTSISPSHLVIQMSMARILSERGHNVTVVTTLKSPIPINHTSINHIQIGISEGDQQMLSSLFGDMAKTDNSNVMLSMWRAFEKLSFIFKKIAETLKEPIVQNLYENNDNNFDLVIVGYFMNSSPMAIAKKLKVPLIVQVCNPPSDMTAGRMLGNPKELSYVSAQSASVNDGEPQTFGKRLANIFTSLGVNAFMYFVDKANEQNYYKLFGDDTSFGDYADLTKNISLMFFASHAPSEGPIRPNVPGVIEVGGIQVKERPDPLPQNMKDFIGNATNGAILLSLGSNIKGSHIKADTMQIMFKVLSKLKQRVIWKWEDLDNTPVISDNILYSKWVPQDDVLAHPNIKLFITHAGKGSITEAQYHGKPMLALPVFGDQPANAAVMVSQDFGLSLSLLTLEEQQFHDSLIEVLENPKYSQNVGKFSTLYRDRPLTARESLIYWTEYVIRHHGAKHLQSPVVHMNFIAANNLDIYTLILVVLFNWFVYNKSFNYLAIWEM